MKHAASLLVKSTGEKTGSRVSKSLF